MTNIYALSEELQKFFANLPDTGELTDEDLATYSELQENIDEKIKWTAYAYLNLQGDLDAITAQIDRLTKLKKSKELHMERIKKLINFGMELEHSNAKDFGDVRIGYTKSTGTVVDDESLVPEEYKKIETKVKVDVALAKKALQAGTKIAGIRLEERKNLNIK